MNRTFQPRVEPFRINYMLLIPTRHSYKDIYQRGYSVNTSANALSYLENLFVENNIHKGMQLSNAVLANNMPGIVSLNNMPIGKVVIPNGWGTVRLRFIMKITANSFSGTNEYYIQGFTDYHDPSISGHIPDDMTFFINSVTEVARMVDPITGAIRAIPKSMYNVISDLAGGTKYEEIDDSGLKLIRPKDVIEGIKNLTDYGDSNAVLITNTGSISSKPNTSDRRNNDPMSYMTKTINSYTDALNDANGIVKYSGMLEQSAQLLTENSITAVPFIMALSSLTGLFTPTSFNLANLKVIQPDIDAPGQNVVRLVDNSYDIATNAGFNTILNTNDTADMLQPTIETMTASSIAQTINSIMMECLLSKLSVSFSNVNGEYSCFVSDAGSFIENIDVAMFAAKANSKIRTILLPEVSKGNTLIITSSVSADVLGDTTVSVSINFGPEIPFRWATFADGLFSPVISNSMYKKGIVDDFSNVFEAINSNRTNMYSDSY